MLHHVELLSVRGKRHEHYHLVSLYVKDGQRMMCINLSALHSCNAKLRNTAGAADIQGQGGGLGGDAHERLLLPSGGQPRSIARLGAAATGKPVRAVVEGCCHRKASQSSGRQR